MAEEKDRMLVEYETTNGMVKLNPTIVRKYLVHGKAELVTDTEVIMYMQLCRYLGMNPFLPDCYLIKYSSSEPATTVTAKDWFMKKAASIKDCEGYNAGIIVRYKKGNKTETENRIGTVTYDGEELVGGWAYAFRKGWREKVEIEVSLKEYMRFSGKGEPAANWKSMPATMIRKVALVQALRETFPDVYAHLHTPEEMPIDDSKLPEEPIRAPEEPKSLPVREEPPNGFDVIVKNDGTVVSKLPQPDSATQEELEIF
jgi:phage recombination protein Bet